MGNRNSVNNKIKSKDSNWLPREIICEILTRVPAESLVRFKLVCKLWKTFISDPKFISSHLHIWQSKPSVIKFTADLLSHRLLLSDLQERDYYTDFLIRIPEYSNIVASTDGLLLLQATPFHYLSKKVGGYVDGEETKLCVHNPVTGSQKLLPPNPNRWDFFLIVHDASIQKYKVVAFIDNACVIHDKINIITVDNDGDRGSLEWRELISPSAFWLWLQGGFKPITVNGILHWLAYTTTYDQVAFVQLMDIAKEEFMQGISLPCQPKTHSDRRLINCNLLEMEGSIYFSNPATDMELELWMLEDLANHIWVKKHKICLLSIVEKPNSLSSFLAHDSFYPIQMIGNHGLMIILHDYNSNDMRAGLLGPWGSYLYNLRSQELKPIVGRSSEVNMLYYYSSHQITHVKSLVGWN